MSQTEYNISPMPNTHVYTPRNTVSTQSKDKGANVITLEPLTEGDQSEKKEKGPRRDKSNSGSSPLNVNVIVRPDPNIEFKKFVEKFGYPRYGNLFEFQGEMHRMCWYGKWSMINVPRDHGKSIYLAFLSEWALASGNWDVLYLGWTDRRKEIAEFVYAYFVRMNQIVTAKVKQSSSNHFQIIGGGKFDTYLITAKEVLGMHALGKVIGKAERKLLMIIDDPIDETFREERHKETKLEAKWRSTLSNINPDKIIFTGTKKFKEDFFYFIKKTYKNKLRHFYRRTHLCTPFIQDLDIFHGDLNHKKAFLSYDIEAQNRMLEKAMAHPCFNPDIQYVDLRYRIGLPPERNLLCPERWSEPELKEKRLEVGEYWWHSEYEQNPHPITGEVWENVQYIKGRETWNEYDLGFIVIDPATATEAKKVGYTAEQKLKATSYTGIVIFLRHVPTQEFHVIFDLTDHYEFEHKLFVITEYFEWLKARFLKMLIKVVIEKQGGGDDLISSASSRKWASWGKKKMRINWSTHIKDVHQTRDKIMRIDDYLRVPIKKSRIKFLISLRKSELITEIINFPYCDKFDAIDALATGIHEAENHIKGQSPEEIKQALQRIRDRRLKKYERDWVMKNQTPWLRTQKNKRRIF